MKNVSDEKAAFSLGLQERQFERSMIASPGAYSYFFFIQDPNMIVYGGFPLSVVGIESAVAHCESRGIDFEL